jgi:DNA-binding transcriptional LysR family regulator
MTTFYYECIPATEEALGSKTGLGEKTMEFQQLEMFAAVVETGSVRRGAERVFRTAPAVSVALRKLEEEMGAPLFDRSDRHNHQLTVSGKALYTYAMRILAMRNEAAASIKDLAKGSRGDLRLGTHESLSLYLLPSLLQRFNEAHRGVKTEVVCGNSDRLLTALADRAVELALMGDAPDEPHLERYFIMQDELVLITSPGHRLAGLKQVHVRDLAGEFLIVQGTKSLLRERFVRALQESETPFNVCVENIAIEAIKRMVAQDLGIGFVPLMCVREEAARGELITLVVDGVSKEWSLWLVRRRDHSLSNAARTFIEVILPRAQSSEGAELITAEPPEKNSGKPDNSMAFSIHPRRAIHC